MALLRRDDFGELFLAVRAHTGWTQETLAGIIQLTQADISKIERGQWYLRDVTIIRRIARYLHIPWALVGFDPTVESDTERKVASWVDRRKFTGHVAGLVLSLAGAAGLDLDRLAALLPQAEPSGTRRVGVADVAIIEQLTAEFARQDFAHGSGSIRDAAVDQLRTAQPSPRAHDRLRILRTVLQPMHASPGITELRDRLATTAA